MMALERDSKLMMTETRRNPSKNEDGHVADVAGVVVVLPQANRKQRPLRAISWNPSPPNLKRRNWQRLPEATANGMRTSRPGKRRLGIWFVPVDVDRVPIRAMRIPRENAAGEARVARVRAAAVDEVAANAATTDISLLQRILTSHSASIVNMLTILGCTNEWIELRLRMTSRCRASTGSPSTPRDGDGPRIERSARKSRRPFVAIGPRGVAPGSR